MSIEHALKKNWQALELHSRNLLECFSNEDWEQAADLTRQRHHLITRHFNLFPVNDNTARFYQENLPTLQNTDNQLQRIAQQNKTKLSQQLRSLETGKTAISAYQKNQH